tara:strand:+ start:5216 stop:5920 length:705 start_codon:yes stop_codon:yes gene_type:complete
MPENLSLLKDIANASAAPFSISSLILNLVVGAIISFILKAHYKKFSSTLNNREEFGNIFPFILLTTVLVISIVKSSLALSLGLVGALSIVRFRTPIKEPEELAYLFICIAAGLGLGANQTLPTVIAIFMILIIMLFTKKNYQKNSEKNMYLSIEYKINSEVEKKEIVKKLNKIIGDEVLRFDLRRLDYRESFIDATYQVNVSKIEILENIINKLNSQFPKISVTYLDQSQVPSI